MNDAGDPQALLRHIAESCGVAVTEVRHFDPELGCKVWTLHATRDKQTWVTFHEDRYQAVKGLADMIVDAGAYRAEHGRT